MPEFELLSVCALEDIREKARTATRDARAVRAEAASQIAAAREIRSRIGIFTEVPRRAPPLGFRPPRP